MKLIRAIRTPACAAVALTMLLLSAAAQQTKQVDVSTETVGTEPKSFLSVVGVWRIESEGDKKVLSVDGRQWKEGQSSAGLADKARALYGERYAEFLDRVQAFEVLETFARGPMVFNERRDRFTGGPLKMWHGVGVFFLKDGKIVEWYDYTILADRR